MKHRTLALAVGLTVLAAPPFAAEERIDAEINAKIRQEGMNNSKIMRTLHFLTDVYGPRVTGSPSLKAAGEWAIKEMQTWGFTTGRMEPWAWGKPGWTNDFASGAITSPVKDKLEFEVLAWTPGTNGTVTAKAFNLIPPDQPTGAELEKYLESIKPEVQNAIVLVGKWRVVPVNITPPAKRRADEQVKQQYDPNAPPGQGRGGRGEGRGGRGDQPAPREGAMAANDVTQRISDFLVASGARLRINDAAREHGQIIAFQNRSYDMAKAVPTVVMRNEDYGRIARILEDGTPVELQFNIVNKLYPGGDDRLQRDRGNRRHRQERRSRDARRTSRLVAFGDRRDGQRDRLRRHDGSRAHPAGDRRQAAPDDSRRAVERRGTGDARFAGVREGALRFVRDPKPEFSKLMAYLNIDSGTGRARGAGVFGPPEAAADRSRDPEALRGLRRLRRVSVDQPEHRRHRQHVVQQRRPDGDRLRAGSDRIQLAHPSHEPGHLRARHRAGRQAVGHHDRLGALSPRDARRDAAALPRRQDAAAAAGPRGRTRGAITREKGKGKREKGTQSSLFLFLGWSIAGGSGLADGQRRLDIARVAALAAVLEAGTGAHHVGAVDGDLVLDARVRGTRVSKSLDRGS